MYIDFTFHKRLKHVHTHLIAWWEIVNAHTHIVVGLSTSMESPFNDGSTSSPALLLLVKLLKNNSTQSPWPSPVHVSTLNCDFWLKLQIYSSSSVSVRI